jgi:HEAT repeat protein
LAVALTGCPPPRGSEGIEDVLRPPHPAWTVKILIVKVLDGTEEESEKAEAELKELGSMSYTYIGNKLKEKLSREKEERLINIMVAIRIKDAASKNEKFRKLAVRDLISLDKRFGVIDQLLLRLETAEQKLANSIFQVLEERGYISGTWSWPEQAWQELSLRLVNNTDLIKRYISYRLGNLPAYDPTVINWDDYDTAHAFTVLSELAISEEYKDLAPLFADMLEADGARIRRQGVRALGHLRYKAAAGKLTEIVVDDPSRSVRVDAAEALGRMKAGEDSAKKLVALLAKGEFLDSRICWALGEMKSQKAVTALIQVVDKSAAMLALGKIGNPLGIKPLIQVLETSNDPRVRGYAARALGNFKTPEVLEALKGARKKDMSRFARAEELFAIFKIEPEMNKPAVKAEKATWEIEHRLYASILLATEGELENVSRMMQDIEEVGFDDRVRFWEMIKDTYEGIPEYHPFGLNYKRASDRKKINEWFEENKSKLRWDRVNKKFRVRAKIKEEDEDD